MKEGISIISESVERYKETIFVDTAPWWESIVRTTFTIPPFKPELRVTVTHFKKKDCEDERDPDVFILHSRQSAQLLVATLRKAADLVEHYADYLPEKED